GSALVCSSEDQIRIVDVTSGRVRFTLPAKGNRALAIAASGKTLAWGDRTELTLWEVATAKERAWIKTSGGFVEALRFSPDGRWLAQGDHEHGVHLYDVLAARKVHTFVGHDASVTG